jgi:N-sulfoglucosamine sulfohydrolase
MAYRSGTLRALMAAAFTATTLLAGCGPSKPPQTGGVAARPPGETRPNVLLILVDHLGPEFDVYGDPTAETPNLDRLAKTGEVFTHAYAAAGSDDAALASILTGVYPQTIGMVQEWVGRRVWTVAPPPEVRGFPETLREAGYTTFHLGRRADPFGASSMLWTNETIGQVGEGVEPWPPIQVSQPFFGEIDLSTVEAPGDAAQTQPGWIERLLGRGETRPAPIPVKPVDPRAVPVPAYLPDSHSMRVALAHRYEAIERVDAEIGKILERLDKLGLASTTDVIVMARSGPALPRAERTLYESGVRIPLIVHRAGKDSGGKGAGVVRPDIVSEVDIAPSILTRAGLKPFAWMQGRERFVSTGDPERYAFSVQGRVGAVFERAFAVRDGRWLYIHNLAFDTPVLALARQGPARIAFSAVAREKYRVERPGLTVPPQLTPAQARVLQHDRPEDEFYDLQKDPFQMTNLAEDDRYAGELQRLSDALNVFAASAPDYSTFSARDLQDLYRPGGVTPTTSAPTAAVRAGGRVLESATPGAVILWRPKDAPLWRIYAGPLPATGDIEAKAARYGFQDSAVVASFPAK